MCQYSANAPERSLPQTEKLEISIIYQLQHFSYFLLTINKWGLWVNKAS